MFFANFLFQRSSKIFRILRGWKNPEHFLKLCWFKKLVLKIIMKKKLSMMLMISDWRFVSWHLIASLWKHCALIFCLHLVLQTWWMYSVVCQNSFSSSFLWNYNNFLTLHCIHNLQVVHFRASISLAFSCLSKSDSYKLPRGETEVTPKSTHNKYW